MMTQKRFRIYQNIYEVFYIEDIQHYSDKKLQKGYKIGHEEDVKYEDVLKVVDLLNALHEENQRLKSDLARVIEQARKNNELCVSDIRILEKALWCSGCENDYDRLRQLRKEFLND